MLKWNGTKWTHQPSPSPGGTRSSILRAVSATAAGDIWAVGEFDAGTRIDTMILHWNGISWSQVASPNPGVSQAILDSVAAISPTNAWAVGNFFDGSEQQTLVLHWNGSTWTQVAAPTPRQATRS